jgi:hypothetical protein
MEILIIKELVDLVAQINKEIKMPVYDDYYDTNKKLTIYINEDDPDFECIEVIRLGTDEHKIFKKE